MFYKRYQKRAAVNAPSCHRAQKNLSEILRHDKPKIQLLLKLVKSELPRKYQIILYNTKEFPYPPGIFTHYLSKNTPRKEHFCTI